MSSERHLDRRGFLAATGGAVVTARSQSGTTTAGPSGTLAFVYDDSPREDFTKTFPIHRRAGVPGCVAVVTGTIGTEGHLTAGNLREMASAGWEVMSHTVRHRGLGVLQVTEPVEAGDTTVYTNSNRHGQYPGDPVVVFDGETAAAASVAGRGTDDTGEYVTLHNPLGESFDADGTRIRYTSERIRRSLRESKRDLERYGLDVSSLVFPYDMTGPRVRNLVPEWYDAVANGRYHGDRLNTATTDPLRLRRAYFNADRLSADELGDYLDAVAENDALGILAGHSHLLSAERIRTAIRMAGERDIAIRTLREALSEPTTTEVAGSDVEGSTEWVDRPPTRTVAVMGAPVVALWAIVYAAKRTRK